MMRNYQQSNQLIIITIYKDCIEINAINKYFRAHNITFFFIKQSKDKEGTIRVKDSNNFFSKTARSIFWNFFSLKSYRSKLIGAIDPAFEHKFLEFPESWQGWKKCSCFIIFSCWPTIGLIFALKVNFRNFYTCPHPWQVWKLQNSIFSVKYLLCRFKLS